MGLHCPVCGKRAHIRTSRPLSDMVTEQYYACLNPKCRTVFVGLVEVSRIVGESLLPTDVQAEFSKQIRRSRRAIERPQEADPRQMPLTGIPAPAS